MTDNVELTKRINKACQAKDFDTVRELFHPDYKLKSPDMNAKNLEEFIEMMENCPNTATLENIKFLSDGETVVQIFDMKATEPVSYSARICDVLKFENGKLRSEEMFYDTGAVPQEAKDKMEKAMKGDKKKAA